MINDRIAIFLDIDGTLYDSSIKAIPEATITILNELVDSHNIDLYISSGRSLNTIDGVLNDFNRFKGYVLSNGQMVMIDNKIIFEGKLNHNDVNNFVKYCDNHKLSIVLLTHDMLYCNAFNETSKKNFESYVKTSVYPLNGKQFTSNDIVEQIWLFATNEEIKEVSKEHPEFNIINWGNYGADIIPAGMSKGEGIKKVIEHIGYKKENTYAIGDGDNDVTMFQNVGTSICMENGSEKAKTACDIIGYHVSKNGLMKNIKEYILKKH